MPQARSSSAADLSPIELTNLSPDSFFGTYPDPQNDDGSLGPYSQRYYLYKANDTLVVGGQAAVLGAYLNAVPAGNNVSIQATDLIIAASFPPIPQADIQIYCRHLTIPAGVTVTIDVSATGQASAEEDENVAKWPINQAAEGQPGQNGVTVANAWAQDGADAQTSYGPPPTVPASTDGAPPILYPFGQNGETGGNITIICDELQLDGTLVLNANGRNGYSGCPGQPGGSAATGQTAGQGGDGQAGGSGGNGGGTSAALSRGVTVQYRTLTSGNIATDLIMNANGGQPGQAGTPGPGGSPNGADGGFPPGSPPGIDGSTSSGSFTDASVLGQAFDEIYLLKAVETAKLQYMLNEPMAFSSAAPDPNNDPQKAVKDMLVWLQSVLSGYATLGLNPSDSDYRKTNLHLIASTYCARISYVPRLTSAGNLASSIPGWVLSTPGSTVAPGGILNWVEQTYLSDGTNTLGGLFATLNNYANAFNTLMTGEVTAEKIQAQYQTYADAAASYKATCDALCAMLDPTIPTSIAGQLSAASTALLTDFNNLLPILGLVQSTIATHYDCNANNVLSTLSQAVPQMLFMASEPELMLPMAAASALPLIKDGITQITDDSGQAIDKSQIITDLKVVTSNDDFINDVEGDLLNTDGTLKSTTTYVLSQLSALVGDISSLSNSIDNDNKDSQGNPKPVAEQAVAAVEVLKQAIITKSQLQLQYQSYAAAAATAWQNYQDAQKRANDINNMDPSKLPTPDLLGHVSHLAMLYQKGLTDYIAFSSQFKRFAAWLSLDNTEDPDLTQVATTLNAYWAQGSTPSLGDPDSIDNIDSTLYSYEENLKNYFLNVGSPAQADPQDPSTQRPHTLVISITADFILDKIRQGVPRTVRGQTGPNGTQIYQYGRPVTIIIVPFDVAAQLAYRPHHDPYPPQTNKDGTTTYFYYNNRTGLFGPMVEFSLSGANYDLRASYAQPRIIGATYKGTYYTGTTLPLPNTNDPEPQSISVDIYAPAERWFWDWQDSKSSSTDHLIFTHPNGRSAAFVHYYLTTPDGTAYDVSGDPGALIDASLSSLGMYGPWRISLSYWTTDSNPNAQIDFSTVSEIQLGFAGTARQISGDVVRRERFAGHAAS
jgi:hypothetical protein